MTAQELIQALERMEPDTEIRFAGQPNWPFEYSISDIIILEEDVDIREDLDHPVAYLAEGEQLNYLPGYVSKILGWR